MRLYILGIAGTFMGSLAQLAKAQGHEVYGVDTAVYPPMSDQLVAAGIEFDSGYDHHSLREHDIDRVIVGNAISRGNPALEYVLDNQLPYVSAPQWIAENVLINKHVFAISGTHGKTTTSSMLAWILEFAGLNPGYLLGGVPENFGRSARLGDGKYFVIEADEYDSAFCDKRSKFVHYRPDSLLINNLEFDHADIFDSLEDIQKQFHHVVRTVPSNGQVLYKPDAAIEQVLAMGCWSVQVPLSGSQSEWGVGKVSSDLSEIEIVFSGKLSDKSDSVAETGIIRWELSGQHNISNALAAVAMAHAVGVSVATACSAMCEFKNVKRRMQLVAEVAGIKVFDDFAHHPTAIRLTLEGARKKYPTQRLVAVIEARSNTMQMGVHNEQLPQALAEADVVWWHSAAQTDNLPQFDSANATVCYSVEQILQQLPSSLSSGDIVVIMSNGAFDGLHRKLIEQMKKSAA